MDSTQKTKQFSEAALRLEAIIKSATDGIIVIDEAGVIEEVNQAAAQLFGYELDELLGYNVSKLMPQPHRKHHDAYIENYLHTGIGKIIGIGREVEGLRKDGSRFPFRLSISEVKLKERRIFTGIVHDLTERKRAEEELQREKERAQRYLDIANTLIVVLNREGKVDLINKKGCELLGYSEEEIKGRDWFELTIPKQDRTVVHQIFQQIIEGQTEVGEYFESQVVTRSGRHQLIAWRNAVIRDENGRPTATISSGVDITEQRAAEQRIEKMNTELEERVENRTEELAEAVNQLLNINKQLEFEIQERKAAVTALRKSEKELRRAFEREKELSELKSRFVSMASHEFRTPLSTILSSADIIEEYKNTDQQHRRERHTNRIKSAVANLTGILNDFLSLGRLEEGNIEHQPVEFEISQFFRVEIIDELRGLIKEGQQIRCHGLEAPLHIHLDKKFLKNILFNLLSNAIKYSMPGDPIDLTMSIVEEHLHIKVQDYGIGIPQEEQQHLFTRFFRARNVENIKGTGLGLNIVKKYVELMDGYISFESKIGEGTTFYVKIPVELS